ncbi:MAG: hypothetical protein AAF773_02465 [Cyanobacteria bacterium P01_D01_bin.115]
MQTDVMGSSGGIGPREVAAIVTAAAAVAWSIHPANPAVQGSKNALPTTSRLPEEERGSKITSFPDDGPRLEDPPAAEPRPEPRSPHTGHDGPVTGGVLGEATEILQGCFDNLFPPYFESSANNSPFSSPYDPQNPGRPDPDWSLDTSNYTGDPTQHGGVRNRTEFWKDWSTLQPESLSESNQYRINELGLSPQVDDTWIRIFPEHAPYKRDTLVHHHVDRGPYAIPVPASTHPGSGGPFHVGDNR